MSVDPAELARQPDRLRQTQRVFGRTGGLHAAAVSGCDGVMLALRADVGRHNAVDKVIAARKVTLPGHVMESPEASVRARADPGTAAPRLE